MGWPMDDKRRKKRRQRLNNTSPSNSEFPPTAEPSRSPRIVSLSALIMASTNIHEISQNLSAIKISAEHSNAPVNIS